ncbi:GNAT family N-acetyltransferase [Rhizobium sp. CG5]|uniref:GNAT family N-acetyltransferase n=1 Tax=Rhizobium sp. CG5 TaxID=2726076 RepID=UPI0020334981|nr:GNAT family N-acetyltransferase [Rhizobium sp. CG5]MCM2473810.1 GNAT family N-acetyltransferase [Rhizobium sp. CG5]
MGPQGACYGCWCTYFRLAASQRKLLGNADKKAFIRTRVQTGPPPGLIGYRDGQPVGWVQVGPRSDVPNWNSSRTVSRPLDEADAVDPGVWAISCFFVVSAGRGTGLSHALLAAAVDFARQNGARRVEACPIDRAKQSKSVGLYVGPTRIFRVAGFEEVALRKAGRPLMQLSLL